MGAKWIGDLTDFPLRAGDVLPLIERGRQYHTALTGARPEPWHHPIVPALRPHRKLLLRTVILIRKKTNNRVHVLFQKRLLDIFLSVRSIQSDQFTRLSK